jgi:capsular exopolysaccharide synthesis family protein
MQTRQYPLILWRWLWLVVLSTALAGGAAFLVSRNTRPVYSATVTLLINQAPSYGMGNADYTSILTSERLARTYSELLRTPKVLSQVADKLGLSGLPAVQVQLVRDTQLLKVSAESTDPELAANIANTLAQVFKDMIEGQQRSRYTALKDNLTSQIQQVEQDIASMQVEMDALRGPLSPSEDARRTQLQTTLTQYRSNYTSLTNNLTQVRLAEAQATSSVGVAQEAEIPAAPVRPRTLTNTALASAVGALLALGVAFLIEYLDDTIKSPDDIEQVAQAPALGLIGRIEGDEPTHKLITAHTPRSPISEAYRVLRTNIQFGSVDKPLSSLLVTSGHPTEGKSTTAANLAVVMAQSGKRVVLVDSDLRRPMQHKYFGVSNERGLTTALLDSQTPVEEHLQATEIDNLRVMSSGPLAPNPAELLGSQRMVQVLDELKQHADMLILDSPPVMMVTDPVLLARQVDGTLVVADAGNTRRAVLARALDALRAANARPLGVALNRISTYRSGYYSYANQYYYYYSNDGQREKGSRRSLCRRWFGRNGHSAHGVQAAVASDERANPASKG